MIRKTIFLTAIALLVFSAMNAMPDDEEGNDGAVVGEKAPNFEVADASGNVHSLSDFEGKYVILEWLNHGCPFVRKHYDGNNMQQLQKKYTEKGVVWLSVVSSAEGKQGYMTPEEADASLNQYGASPTAILLDTDGEMGKSYDARVTPHMYIIDPDGILRYNGAIDDQPSARPSSLEGAHNYIDAAMNSLMNGEEVAVKTNTPYGCTVKYAS